MKYPVLPLLAITATLLFMILQVRTLRETNSELLTQLEEANAVMAQANVALIEAGDATRAARIAMQAGARALAECRGEWIGEVSDDAAMAIGTTNNCCITDSILEVEREPR